MEIGETLRFTEEVRLSDYIIRHSWVRDTVYGPVDFGYDSLDFEHAARDLKERLLKPRK
jgi:hypothetical protein